MEGERGTAQGAPGDLNPSRVLCDGTLVFTTPRELSHEQVQRLRERVAARFPTHEVVILDGGSDLRCLAHGEDPAEGAYERGFAAVNGLGLGQGGPSPATPHETPLSRSAG